MEGLVLHGAAHVFFENKLGELETQINSKFKRIEMKLKKEMKEIFNYQSHEISKIKMDIQGIKEELNLVRQSEETITQKGMTKLSKLSKEVKTELNEIKKLKTDVNGLKKEVSGIRQSEEDLSKMGMDKLAKMNEEFKSDVKQLRTEMKSVKKDVVAIKVASNKKMIEADPDPGENDVIEPDKEKEKIKPSRKKSNSYREPKVPPTITELLNSSEEEIEKTQEDKNKTATNAEASTSNKDNEAGDKIMPNNDTNVTENGVLQSFGGADYQDNYLKNYNDDHIRKLVFSSQESSDYQHESSEYHESDAVSDDEEDRNHHFDKTFNVKRIYSKKFLYK